MSDDELGGELDRVLRVALTASGQLAERVARSRADEERTRHTATLDAQRQAEREIARQVEAGRAVYGGVRDPQLWEQPNAQRLLGEALVVAQALREVDLLAGPAVRHVKAESRRRYGPDSDAWLAAGVQSYLDDIQEEARVGEASAEPQGRERGHEHVEDPTAESARSDAEVAAEAFPVSLPEDLQAAPVRKAPKPRRGASRGAARERARDRGR